MSWHSNGEIVKMVYRYYYTRKKDPLMYSCINYSILNQMKKEKIIYDYIKNPRDGNYVTIILYDDFETSYEKSRVWQDADKDVLIIKLLRQQPITIRCIFMHDNPYKNITLISFAEYALNELSKAI